MADTEVPRTPCSAPELLLKVVLVGTLSHYETRGMIDDKRLEHMLHAGKQILYKSHQENEVRQNLGFSPTIWQGLADVLHRAIPVLEVQSFAWKNPLSATHTGSSSDLIALNYFGLVKDIERLNDLCTIARNLLATTKKAQNLAADKGFDQQILKLIDVCLRVTARGFDGETNARTEERWQKIVNLYKRLLITSLQFLHNSIMHNEHRKLVLWLDLFGVSQHAEVETMPTMESAETAMAKTMQEVRIKATVEQLPTPGSLTTEGGLGYGIDDVHALFDLMNTERPPDGSTQAAARSLMDKIRNDMERISGLSASQLDENPEALLRVGAALRAQLPTKDFPLRPPQQQQQQQQQQQHQAAESLLPARKAVFSIDRNAPPGQARTMNWTDLPDLSQYGDVITRNAEATREDMSMPRTSQSAAETLQEAKDELIARLHEAAPMMGHDDEQLYDLSDTADGMAEDGSTSMNGNADSIEEEDEDEEAEEDDEDYRNPSDQERGLLTDVPLVLGPTEIEALPMIIQAGIVDSFGLKGGERSGAKNMQAVRCHILLAQEAGRNVLRELLIFIAAWDLPDDEFYFKMMVQIMEAILQNGLMSHAYSDFGQAKDIISPAQAVVIKILTHIFRSKYSPAAVTDSTGHARTPRPPATLTRVDVLTVRYIFTVFRGNIVPETCALIYLQGQIRAGAALAEDFPLNLWDMERVYEGVYQFLEFFAVLTESNDWKRLLVEWDIVYDLVTLLKELDANIPAGSLMAELPAPPTAKPTTTITTTTATNTTTNGGSISSHSTTSGNTTKAALPPPVSVERPYDPTAPDPIISSTSPSLLAAQSPEDQHQQRQLHKYPAPEAAGAAADSCSTTSPPPSPPPRIGTEDPADFEWRNLKKLIVLVLSSLVWKSSQVQDQIRHHGGVETILACTNYDAHNPYIKEHAVMCLKFLLEGNRDNQRIVEELEARRVVGGGRRGGGGLDNSSSGGTFDGGSFGGRGKDDVLREFGLEARIGRDGRVKLVEHRTRTGPNNSNGGNSGSSDDDDDDGGRSRTAEVEEVVG